MKYVYYIVYSWGSGVPQSGGMADWGYSASEITLAKQITHVQDLKDIVESIKSTNSMAKEVLIQNWIYLRSES